jgi:hypothetical protein
MKNRRDTSELCTAFHAAIELIGKRWTGAIIFLLLRSRCRFATLRDAIPDITDRMLTERLQELEQQGIVERTVLPRVARARRVFTHPEGACSRRGRRRHLRLGSQMERSGGRQRSRTRNPEGSSRGKADRERQPFVAT